MNFILIGCDSAAAEFVREARERSHRLLAYVDVPSATEPPTLGDASVLHDIAQVSGIAEIDYLVMSGKLDGRSKRLQYVLRLDPVDLVLADPLAATPDIYYELSLVQSETNIRVLHLVSETTHPATARMAALLESGSLGPIRWVEWTHAIERGATGALRFRAGWNWLRILIGEISEVSSTGAGANPSEAAPIVVSARSANGTLATARWLESNSAGHRLSIETEAGTLQCDLPDGFAGAANLHWTAGDERFEEQTPAASSARCWLDQWEEICNGSATSQSAGATRDIEIAHAVQRSLSTQRTVSLAHEEISGEAAFKSIMTSAGCGLVWLVIIIAILVAAEVPFVGYLVLPILVVFLALQLFGLVYRKSASGGEQSQGQ